jgi:hypothetical protein
MKELTKAIYGLLSPTEELTAAGACHILRGMGPALSEAEQSLEWLERNAHARMVRNEFFGPEYVLVVKR